VLRTAVLDDIKRGLDKEEVEFDRERDKRK